MTEKSKFWKDLKSGRFVSMVKESSKKQSISNSQEVYNIMKPLFAEDDDVEKVYFLFLDAQNKILSIENLFSGSLTASSIYPREIVKRLIHLKASAFIMVHNHPSGDIKPSAEDKSITMKVGVAAASIDVQLHDHLIIGEGFHSMADTGWLRGVSKQFSNLLKSEPALERRLP
ncbi:DNA repair protein RadC [Patescibacteria group bacterium]|nr:DNA repair protein RadC [Patescibacteria group bacterium]MBU4311060.1 DNA repair protein RadC [bacterium]